MFPDLFNFKGVNIIDILTFLATTALGIGAVLTGINANKIAKTAMKSESDRHIIDSNISLMEKRYEVYKFFAEEIRIEGYLEESDKSDDYYKHNRRLYEIEHLAKFIFRDEIYDRISNLIYALCLARLTGTPFVIEDTKKIYTNRKQLLDAFRFDITTDVNEIRKRKNDLLDLIKANIDESFTEYSLRT